MLIGYIAGIGGIAVISLRSLGWLSNKRGTKNKEEDLAKRRELLLNTYVVRTDSQREIWRLSHAKGEGAYAFVGSYALNLFPAVVWNSLQVGCDGHMGGMLVVDFEQQRRYSILATMPQEVQDKVTMVACPNLPGGFHGDTYEDVEEKEHLWGADLRDGCSNWLRYIEHNNDPEFLMVYMSPGAHAALAPTIIHMYKARYPDKPVYVITMLDSKDVVRERFPTIRRKIMKGGLVRGMVITENRHNSRENDEAVTLFPSVSHVGGFLGQDPSQMTNILGWVFARDKSVRYAKLVYWSETLAVKYLPASEALDLAETDEERELLGDRHYTRSNLVEEKIPRGLKDLMAHPELQSIPLRPAPSNHLRSMTAVAPISPEPDYVRLAKRLDDNLKGWKQTTGTNLAVSYASFGAALPQEDTESNIAVILLQPLDDDGSGIDALARNESPKLLTDSQLTAEVAPDAEAPTTPTTRGRGRPRKEQNDE